MPVGKSTGVYTNTWCLIYSISLEQFNSPLTRYMHVPHNDVLHVQSWGFICTTSIKEMGLWKQILMRIKKYNNLKTEPSCPPWSKRWGRQLAKTGHGHQLGYKEDTQNWNGDINTAGSDKSLLCTLLLLTKQNLSPFTLINNICKKCSQPPDAATGVETVLDGS